MYKEKGARSARSSKDSKETKEAKEKRESKDARETKRERDDRDFKAAKDLKGTRSDHGKGRDCKCDYEGRRNRERDGRNERDSRSERETRRDRESKVERESESERNSRSELGTRKARESKNENDERCDRATRSECIRDAKNSKDVHVSESLARDAKRSKNTKEAKLTKEEKMDVECSDTKILMQDIKDLIMRALECELGGHILEARMLYEESLAKLQICSAKEQNEEISESYRKYLGNYEKHVQRLRDQIDQNMFGCKIIEHIAIPEGTRGRSYEKLFDCYLNEKVSLVHIYEPCLTQSTHLEHLIHFVEVLVKNCPSLMFLRLITRASPKSSKLQSEVLHELREELESGNISFNYQFDEQLKKPRIILNTGVVIRCRRGLHIYKPMSKYYKLGLYDYDFRRCEAAEFDVYQGKPFSEAISKADKTDLMESLLHA